MPGAFEKVIGRCKAFTDNLAGMRRFKTFSRRAILGTITDRCQLIMPPTPSKPHPKVSQQDAAYPLHEPDG
ncbi:unnamed protein product [Arctogadus glacialis]